MISYGQHQFPGKLFVVEGTDGSGKSTQLALLYQWLKAEGYPVFFSEWNSSPLVKDTTKRAKKRHLFTPATFSLLHATDFADRTERDIIPPLKAGAIVLADRYIYTAFARDVARGCDRAWVRRKTFPLDSGSHPSPSQMITGVVILGRASVQAFIDAIRGASRRRCSQNVN
jgi:dTMP kinase